MSLEVFSSSRGFKVQISGDHSGSSSSHDFLMPLKTVMRGREPSARLQGRAAAQNRPPPVQDGTATDAEGRDPGAQPGPTQQVEVPIPADLVQELRDMLRAHARQEDRLTQVEEHLLTERANTMPELRRRGDRSPTPRAVPSRRHRSPPGGSLSTDLHPVEGDEEVGTLHPEHIRPHLTTHTGQRSPRKGPPTTHLGQLCTLAAVHWRGFDTYEQKTTRVGNGRSTVAIARTTTHGLSDVGTNDDDAKVAIVTGT